MWMTRAPAIGGKTDIAHTSAMNGLHGFPARRARAGPIFSDFLRRGHIAYVLNDDALDYMKAHGLSKKNTALLRFCGDGVFQNDDAWKTHLEGLGIQSVLDMRIATEGALMGHILSSGFNRDMVVVSDDAGQFNILLHALCWVHAERSIKKLTGFTEEQREAVKKIRGRIWGLYADLKEYKESPAEAKRAGIEADFDDIFTSRTCFNALNNALKRIYDNRKELLLVLDRPDIPLHNNTSERDIREYVKKRKISGSTRSEAGRKCRDTFASLKKTCRKLGVSFWEYVKDRVSSKFEIPFLSDLIRQRALESSA